MSKEAQIIANNQRKRLKLKQNEILKEFLIE